MIRIADEASDWPGIWAVFEPIVREGQTYPLDTDLSETGARAYWFAPDKTVFVADDAEPRGSSAATTSSPTRPAPLLMSAMPVTSCGRTSAGAGLRSRSAATASRRARRRGFRAMQYNLVGFDR